MIFYKVEIKVNIKDQLGLFKTRENLRSIKVVFLYLFYPLIHHSHDRSSGSCVSVWGSHIVFLRFELDERLSISYISKLPQT